MYLITGKKENAAKTDSIIGKVPQYPRNFYGTQIISISELFLEHWN